MAAARILVVEDDPGHAELIKLNLEDSLDYEIKLAATYARAQALMQGDFLPDLILADMRLPDGDGIDFVTSDPARRLPVVLMTSFGNEALAVDAIKAGALDYIVKSNAAFTDLPHLLERALREWRNITERQRAERILQEQQAHLRNLFDRLPIGIIEVDFSAPAPRILNVNRWIERQFGWSAAELRQRGFEPLLPAPESAVLQKLNLAAQAQKTLVQETFNITRFGQALPVRYIATPLQSASQVLVAVEDISAQVERRSEEDAILDERRRIAAEIHDGLAQNLAYLRMRTTLWHDLVDKNPVRMHAELDTLNQLLGENIREVRRSIFALRPPALDELGFIPALQKLVSDLSEQSQLRIAFELHGEPASLPARLELPIYRIVQELLNNIARHAQARRAALTLDLTAPGALTLVITDDGQGLDLTQVEQAALSGHLGLRQIRERIARLGGQFNLASQPGSGTRIAIFLPFRD